MITTIKQAILEYKPIMDFKEFDLLVKTYYPLNKGKTRYLIMFNNGDFYFYKYGYDKTNKYFYFKKECCKWNERT